MAVNTKVIKNYQTAEYGKFVELLDSRFPSVSVIRSSFPDQSNAFPNNTGVAPTTSVDVYPKYGVLSYIANPEDISFSVYLSAENVSVELEQIEQDVHRVITLCNVMTAQNASVDIVSDAGLNAMRVLTQDLESSADDITIGDKQGHFANVDAALSALDVRMVNATPLSAVVTNTVTINTNQTLPVSGNVTVTNPVTQVTTIQEPTQLDAFGRLRISSPMTLFDSSHRYRDNNLWASLTAVGGTYGFNENQGLVEMTVSGLLGSSVIRETTKVFSYQPGKSLLVMNTFVMASSTTNLRQRVGYFGQDNGIYLQLDGDVLSFVERTLVNGSPSTENIIPKSAWNGDKLDGTGPSGLTLDITKAQILWTDIEWLGLGTVRMGFVINGKFIVCHSFHHANLIASTYITTASLPLRYEITNKGVTGVSKTLKQVCSTVISEGGYELRGLQQSIGTTITAPKTLATQGTFYPVASIRLKTSPNRLDAIVILTALSLMGVGTGIYQWKVFASSSTTGGGAWQSAGPDSSVEYKLDGTTVSGGRTMAEGYFTSNTQGATTIDILKEALFKFQLERDGLTGTPYELCVAVAASTNGELVHGSMDWEEISR
jgi:hypothetical protein